MRKLAAALTVTLMTVLSTAASASSRPQSFSGYAWIGIKGWGTVTLNRGLTEHRAINCTEAKCGANEYLLNGARIILNAKSYKGWKFAGWHGACKSRKPKCAINVKRLHANRDGQRVIHVGATFIPVAAGLTPGHPIPIGTAANVGQGFVVKVNSANANVLLTPAAPAGAEYFDANVTVTYTGGGSQDSNYFGFSVVGSHNTPYETVDGNGCTYPGPQPPFDDSPLFSGQSTTGFVCWTIAANDADSLEMYYGDRTLNSPGTTWLALH